MKPIIFSTEMVQAILDGRKTQTRRIAPFDKFCTKPVLNNKGNWDEIYNNNPNPNKIFPNGWRALTNYKPKYQAGDILWVREMFTETDAGSYIYKASFPEHFVKWRPSIHMPLNAARIFLEVNNVRVERLQDISEEDAIAEGLKEGFVGNEFSKMQVWRCGDGESYEKPSWGYKALWEKINGDKHPWKSNPWVWVYEFKLIEKPQNI